jgi:hypothetical protein
MKSPDWTQWIAWMVGTGMGCVAITAYAFTKFETKDDATSAHQTLKDDRKEERKELMDRLQRIENLLLGKGH